MHVYKDHLKVECYLTDASGRDLHSSGKHARLCVENSCECRTPFLIRSTQEINTSRLVTFHYKGFAMVKITDGNNMYTYGPMPLEFEKQVMLDSPAGSKIASDIMILGCDYDLVRTTTPGIEADSREIILVTMYLRLRMHAYERRVLRMKGTVPSLDPKASHDFVQPVMTASYCIDSREGIYIQAPIIYDSISTICHACVVIPCDHFYLIKAKVNYFYTISDGKRKVFTSRDALIDCGNGGIPGSKQGNIVNLFINGVLQPSSMYEVEKDQLILLSEDVPVQGVPIILQNVELYDSSKEQVLTVFNRQFYTVSDGEKRVYTCLVELSEGGSCAIPESDESSYISLFVNGILQPRKNYKVEKGKLTFLTEDVPAKGVPIILQYVRISSGQWNDERLKCEESLCIFHSDGISKVYKDRDQPDLYGNFVIHDPLEVSYTNLFINGILQPSTHYSVTKGKLTLLTADIPHKGVPIILQQLAIYGSRIRYPNDRM